MTHQNRDSLFLAALEEGSDKKSPAFAGLFLLYNKSSKRLIRDPLLESLAAL